MDGDQRGARAVVVAPVLGASDRVVGGGAEAAGQVGVQRLERALEAQQLDVATEPLQAAAGPCVHGNR